MENPNKEICTIRIVFPVESDEQAIGCKKKIGEIMRGIPEVQTQFAIMGASSLREKTSLMPT